MRDDVRVQSDGTTVWVHDSDDGSCIGRFGRMGIDIHRPISQQAEHGQCLLCTHGPTDAAHWRRFVAAMNEIYGVKVSERHRPRYIASDMEKNVMTTMKTYVVEGEHPVVPGRQLEVHLDQAAADRAALEMVKLIANGVDGAPDAPSDAGAWRTYLEDVQRAIAGNTDGSESVDDLDDLSDCYVQITVVETTAPRVVVSLEGGLVQGIVCDVALEGFVVDYDVEGASLNEIIDLAQDGDDTAEATMHDQDATVDSAWVDRVVSAYRAHDYESDQTEED